VISSGLAFNDAFADHSEVTIVPAAGSGAPGCEETADDCFIPNIATVDVGGVVIMSNTDSAAHTFTSGTPGDGASGIFDTGLLMTGTSFEWSPDTVSEIPYYCAVHPWMIGLIVVQEAGVEENQSDPIIHPNSPCTDGCGIEGNNPDLKIFASGYIENPIDGVSTISSVWKDSDGVIVYDAILQVDSQGQFNNEFDNPMFVRDMRDTGMYTTTYQYDDVVLEYQWSYVSYIFEPAPEDGEFVLPCSMQEAGDGVSAGSCHGFYTNEIARAEVGINYHSGLFPIENYEAGGFFLDENGVQGPNISVTHNLINPGDSAILIFENSATGFVSEFQMQMIGGDLIVDEHEPSGFELVIELPNSDGEEFDLYAERNEVNNLQRLESFVLNSNEPLEVLEKILTEMNEGEHLNLEKINSVSRWTSDGIETLEYGIYWTQTRAYVDIERITSQVIEMVNDGMSLQTAFNQFDYILNQSTPDPEPEPDSLTVYSSSSYDEDSTIVIHGTLSPSLDDATVLIQFFDEGSNSASFSREVNIESGGEFTTTIEANEFSSGEYIVKATYKNLVAEDDFEIEAEDDGYLPPIPQPEPEPEHSEVTITPAAGSGAPGCEETADGCYHPSTARIVAGGYVIMHNTDTAAHTFTAGTPDDGPSGEFDTGLIMAGQSFEYSPDTEGIIPYFCMVHPWMVGEIIVGEGGSAPSPIRISVKTDRNSYHIGDELKITGVVKPSDGSSVILQIFSSSGNLVFDERIRPSSNGAFREEIKLAGSEYRDTGTWTVKAISKSASDKVQFLIKAGIPDDVPLPNTESEVTIVPAAGSGAPGCEDTSDGCYLPSIVSVSAGGVVIMSNTDSAAHTFTAGTPSDGPTGEFDTGLLMARTSFEWSPRNEGEVPYFCMVHPWMVGTILVGEGTVPTPHPEPPSEDHIDLEITAEKRVYDINTVAVLDISLSGTNKPQNVAIDVTDPRGTTVISRSVMVDPDEGISFEFKIDENSKTGNYKVTATTSDGSRTVKDSTHFKVKSQFNSFKITSVEITDQKGNPSDLELGEIGFIKVNMESNKSIATLVTVNIFDSELTSIGIGSVQTTLSSGGSEIILSFNIPDDAATGTAEIFVNAFSDWPSDGGIPLTREVSTVEDIS